jgi:mitogen-activated protein kinase kinase kinase 9
MTNDKVSKHRTFNNNLEIDFKELSSMTKIAEGGYGIIYKARWRDTWVAVKMFKMDQMN